VSFLRSIVATIASAIVFVRFGFRHVALYSTIIALEAVPSTVAFVSSHSSNDTTVSTTPLPSKIYVDVVRSSGCSASEVAAHLQLKAAYTL